MKHALIAVAAVALMAAGAAQAENKNNSGCGLGTVAFKGQTGLAPQVMAVTTNGSSGNQTFAISTGTSGCTKNGVVDPPKRVAAFTGSNIDKLARDAARGQGESLESLAALMGIDEMHKPAFYRTSQRNFGTIFPSENVTADSVLKAWYGVMSQDKMLSRYAGV
ncbi:MAG: DUF3015 domain-containing protein [Alphaproteobacteria bacterium]|nr:DUF3015 domain-containing protein [Alphaproteobacteria bacterium]